MKGLVREEGEVEFSSDRRVVSLWRRGEGWRTPLVSGDCADQESARERGGGRFYWNIGVGDSTPTRRESEKDGLSEI